MSVQLPDLTYSVVAQDGRLWLVILVTIAGPATVIGRWDSKEAAEADALRWMQLESEASK